MMKLIHLELRKIIPYKMFWIMTGIYLVSLLFFFYGLPSLIDYFSLKSNAPEVKLLKGFLYNFPDIWQNLAWAASLRFFIKIFLGIIMVILVTNEYSYLTIRSNIINGLSRTDFLLSKVYLAIMFSLVATFLVFITGLVLGILYSPTLTWPSFFSKMIFLPGYFTEILAYLLFAMMVSILLKRTGIAIGLLFVYPIVELIIQQKVPAWMEPYLPVNAINHILRTPNTSLIQYKSPEFTIDLQTSLQAQDFAVALLYAALFVGISLLVIRRRDI
ncbi:MAG: ABC transporter permease [Bacteroidales bacterium]|nr:ABC transporter permease [Bacteroidales bacterium]